MAELPDLYADGFTVVVTPWDVVLALTRLGPQANPSEWRPEPTALVRMSHETAKALAILLKRHVKTHEAATGGPVRMPPQVMQGMGISPDEDW